MIKHTKTLKESAPSRAQRLAKKGDVFYQTVRPYQKNNYLYELQYNNYIFSTGYAQLRPYSGVDSNFLLNCVQEEKFVTTVLNFCTGTSYPAINSKDLGRVMIKIPKSTEQQKIGDFFKHLDELITLHQRELDNYKMLKKTMLSKMFPKNDEKYPEIRFTGFAYAWELRRADEIFKTISDKGHPDLTVLSASQEHGMIPRNDVGVDIKYDKKNTANYKRVKPEQFVIHLRSFQGGFAWSEIEGITSPAYTVLDYKETGKYSFDFWKEVLTSPNFIKRLESVTYGIRDGRSISFSDFSTLKFSSPEIREQQKIGSFFKHLDELITLHQRGSI